MPNNNDDIVNKLQVIISQLEIVPNHQIDVAQLQQIETDLASILPQIQFEMTDARMQGNWQEASELKNAYQECKNALNSVRAAIVRAAIIGINQENLTEIQKILGEVKTASENQKRIEFVVASLQLVRNLFR